MTQQPQRTYAREFKLEAIRLYESTGKSMSEVERDLGITPYLLSKWVRQFRQEEAQAFPSKGKRTERDEELRRLRREVEILQQEREVLKKQSSSSHNPSAEVCLHPCSSRPVSPAKDVRRDGSFSQWLLCLSRSASE